MRASRWVPVVVVTTLVAIFAVSGGPVQRRAEAAFPGDDGVIVFEVSEYPLYFATIGPDGSGLHVLDFWNPYAAKQAWVADERISVSPEGGRLLFLYRGGEFRVDRWDLMSVNVDGSDLQNLGAFPMQTIDWSPDGDMLVFGSTDGLRVAPVGSPGDSTLLAPAGSGTGIKWIKDAAWSPDASTIAFTEVDRGDRMLEIWAVDADGTDVRLLWEGGSGLNTSIGWSPDGTRLVFVDDYRLASMAPDGSDVVGITGPDLFVREAVWSPSGGRIGFVADGPDPSGEGGEHIGGIWTIEPDGSDLELVHGEDGFFSGGIDWQARALSLVIAPSSIHVGDVVTVEATTIPPGSEGNLALWFAPDGGGGRQEVASSTSGSGTLTGEYQPTRKGAFVASWSGDLAHPGGWSEVVPVVVRPDVRARMIKADAVDGETYLYAYERACAREGRACPRSVVRVVPPRPGAKVRLTLQRDLGSGWVKVASIPRTLSDRSKVVATWGYEDRSVIGVPSRVRAAFLGDRTLDAATSPWVLFEVRRPSSIDEPPDP